MNERVRQQGYIRLAKALHKKDDEFFTSHYDANLCLQQITEHLRGKVIYCNCDNPAYSAIVKWFCHNYNKLQLKGLYCSYYNPNVEFTTYAYKYDGVNWHRKRLEGQGSYDDAELLPILRACDIVVTNPPFSKCAAFCNYLFANNVKFIIISNITIISNHALHFLRCLHFVFTPTRQRLYLITQSKPLLFNGKRKVHLGMVNWLTNMPEVDKRKKCWPLVKYDPKVHRPFDNWRHCININRLADTPCDYNGLMAVPITILSKKLAFDYTIIGIVSSSHNPRPEKWIFHPKLMQDGRCVFTRFLILRMQ